MRKLYHEARRMEKEKNCKYLWTQNRKNFHAQAGRLKQGFSYKFKWLQQTGITYSITVQLHYLIYKKLSLI